MDYSYHQWVNNVAGFFHHQNYATNAQTLATVGSLLFTAQTFIFQIITDKKDHFFFLDDKRKKKIATLWSWWIISIFANCSISFLLASFDFKNIMDLFVVLAILNLVMFTIVLGLGCVCFLNYQSIFVNQFQKNTSLIPEDG
ncbi:MAG: hypothetical protein H2174_06460 [Vampirovibrio sp.]|nr:hypothetical protein [Vampirovibrio sp.]